MTIRFPHLNLVLEEVPGFYEILRFRVTMMGLLIAAAMLVGVLIIILEAKRKHQSVNRYLGAMIFGILGGVAGGRALYAACNWERYQEDMIHVLFLRDGGYGFLGALLGGVIFLWIFCLAARIGFGETSDVFVIPLVLGQILGRFGDFFCRQSFGDYTDSFFAMQIPLAGVRAGDLTENIRAHLVEIGGIPYIQVHPAFLYECAACLILFFVLVGISRHKKYAGQVFNTYMAWYGLIRFVLCWIRTDKMLIPGTELDVNMVISAAMFVLFGLVGFVRSSMAKKRTAFRRARQEERYAEEERAGAEFDRQEEERERKIREIQEERQREAEAAGEHGEEIVSAEASSAESMVEVSMEDPEQSETQKGQPETEISKDMPQETEELYVDPDFNASVLTLEEDLVIPATGNHEMMVEPGVMAEETEQEEGKEADPPEKV